MENSMRFGLMAVFAVSGSMVLLVHQVHKRILSNFMEKFEFEVSYPQHQNNFHGNEKHHHHHHVKKRVRFAKQMSEVTMEKKGSSKNVTMVKGKMENGGAEKGRRGTKLEDMMPPNRAVLYKGIMKYRNIYNS